MLRMKNGASRPLTAGISLHVLAVGIFLLPSLSMGGEPTHELDVTMSGKLSAVIGDPMTILEEPESGSKKQNPVLKHFLTDDQGKTIEVKISPELLQSFGDYQKLRDNLGSARALSKDHS